MAQEKYKEVLIIYSDFYPLVSENLLSAAKTYLKEKKIEYDAKRVDGSLELPIVLSKFKDKYSGFIVLGCIVKGERSDPNKKDLGTKAAAVCCNLIKILRS